MCIVLNSLALAFYNYSDRQSVTKQNQVLDQINNVFTVIFIMEFMLKIVAFGFIVHRNSYLRNGWNLIDFVVVVGG